MKWYIRVIFFLLVLVFFQYKFVGNVEARSGCCSYHGGVCGCECCDGTPLSDICAPDYGCGYGGYQPPPTCPLMSIYNSLTGQCECLSGYVASGNSCISADQSCKNQYGYNSETDYSGHCKCRYGYVWNSSRTSCVNQDQECKNQFGYNSKATISGDQCECNYGYVWNSTRTKCVDPDEICKNEFGYNSKATLSGDQCECNYGYTFNKSRNKCITKDAACQEIYGLMSRNGLSDKCECMYGYEFNGSQCVYSSKNENDYVVDPVVVKPTAVPTVKPKVIVKPTVTLIPTQVVSLVPTQTEVLAVTKVETKPIKSESIFLRFFRWLSGKK